jgi:hypothetical protein
MKLEAKARLLAAMDAEQAVKLIEGVFKKYVPELKIRGTALNTGYPKQEVDQRRIAFSSPYDLDFTMDLWSGLGKIEISFSDGSALAGNPKLPNGRLASMNLDKILTDAEQELKNTANIWRGFINALEQLQGMMENRKPK